MSIKIFNTLSKKKEVFKPVNEDKVSMYVCGPTVYSNPHIGNARSALIGDLWFRVLKNRYKNVTYIRNITDVDDKIIDAASHEKKTVTEISEQYSKIYKDNMELLGLLIPTIEPIIVAQNITTSVISSAKYMNKSCFILIMDHLIIGF